MTVIRPRVITADSRCANTMPDDDNQMVSLHPGSRYVATSENLDCMNSYWNYLLLIVKIRRTTLTVFRRQLTRFWKPVSLSVEKVNFLGFTHQVCGAAQACVFWRGLELHRALESVSILGSQRYAVTIHAHRLGRLLLFPSKQKDSTALE